MGLQRAASRKWWLILVVSFMFLLAFLPGVHDAAVADEVDFREPVQLYFAGTPYSGMDTFMSIWNQTKQFEEMSKFSTLGNYSVLIYGHCYRAALGGGITRDVDYFVLASTLQPDDKGLIHQVVARFHIVYKQAWHGPDQSNLIEKLCYQQSYGFNPTSDETAKEVLESFSQGWLVYEDNTDYPPFIVFQSHLNFSKPSPLDQFYPVTVVLNQLTGKVVIAAEISNDDFARAIDTEIRYFLWRRPTIDPHRPLQIVNLEIARMDFQFGNTTSGSLLVVIRNKGSTLTVENVSVLEGSTGNLPVYGTHPQLPFTVGSTGSEVALNISTSISEFQYYTVTMTTSTGYSFSCCIRTENPHPPPPPPPYISSVNFDFMAPRIAITGKKIDVCISNYGEIDKIVGLCIGTSPSTLQDQNTEATNLIHGEQKIITVSYNWTEGLTYYFRADFASGSSSNYSAQAPPVGWLNPKEGMVLVSVEPQILNVKEGEVFNVNVTVDNLSALNGAVGFEFFLQWNQTTLQGLNMTEVVCHEVAPQSDWVKSLWHAIPVNGSRTRALGGVEYSVLLPREIRYEQTVLQNGITGNHTIATIAFKALEPGSTTLHLSVVTLVFLLGEHIDRFLLDGYVTVADTHVQDPPIIPESSLPIFLVLFTTSAALSAVFTRKGRFRVLPQTHV